MFNFFLENFGRNFECFVVFAECHFANLLIAGDGAALGNQILLNQLHNPVVARRVIFAAGKVFPLFGVENRRAAQFNDPFAKFVGMVIFFVGVFHKLGHDGGAHRPFGDQGADPVLIIGQPFFRQRFVQGFQEFVMIDFADFLSHLSHFSSP